MSVLAEIGGGEGGGKPPADAPVAQVFAPLSVQGSFRSEKGFREADDKPVGNLRGSEAIVPNRVGTPISIGITMPAREKRVIFVFGSNLAGRHGKGAALFAKKHHGAIYGQGSGLQGDSYAIPTKDVNLQTLPLNYIEFYVKQFISFAEAHPDWSFNVTRVGCGLAGYTDDQIGPMFKHAPKNCALPTEWDKYVEDQRIDRLASDLAQFPDDYGNRK